VSGRVDNATRTRRTAEIIEAYKAGEVLETIASRHGVTRQRVEQIARENNLPRRRPNRRSARANEARPA
jgi:hypothetical protein